MTVTFDFSPTHDFFDHKRFRVRGKRNSRAGAEPAHQIPVGADGTVRQEGHAIPQRGALRGECSRWQGDVLWSDAQKHLVSTLFQLALTAQTKMAMHFLQGSSPFVCVLGTDCRSSVTQRLATPVVAAKVNENEPCRNSVLNQEV